MCKLFLKFVSTVSHCFLEQKCIISNECASTLSLNILQTSVTPHTHVLYLLHLHVCVCVCVTDFA